MPKFFAEKVFGHKQHYLEMFAKWAELSKTGFYGVSSDGAKRENQ